MYCFPIAHAKPAFLQPSNFCSKSRIYKQLDTHAQHKASKIAIYIYLVLTFFLDHHILCLQLLVKIYPLSPITCFLQTQTNHYNCISYYYFRENKSIVRSLSPLLRLGFLTLCFPDLLSKNKSPRLIFLTLPVVIFIYTGLWVYFFCQNARE